ncbi:hypothetical protein D3C75_569560 [compost metagenome]
MARRFELSLSPDYVPNWTLTDGVREFFQNALDQETSVEGNKMFFEYDEEKQQLRVGNKYSTLEKSSLLLGVSSKRNSKETIGQFGEGYKIASLVLTRIGRKVTVYNYGAREVWTAKLIKSRRYNSEILVFDVDTKYPWTKVPDNNLTITIDDVSPEDYATIIESNLHLAGYDGIMRIETTQGNILLDPDYKGKVFVKGLFVVDFPSYKYGYDFKPSFIKLDRDRKMISDFELQWAASGMWNSIPDDNQLARNLLLELVQLEAQDVAYLTSTLKSTTVVDEIASNFYKKHGDDAVPVRSQYDYDQAKGMGLKPQITNGVEHQAIKRSSLYKEPKDNKVAKVSIADQLEAWRNKYKSHIPFDGQDELDEIIGRLTYLEEA